MYKITIEKQVENPNYEEELKERKTPYAFASNAPYPERYFLERVITCELNEAEYEAVKKAIISVS